MPRTIDPYKRKGDNHDEKEPTSYLSYAIFLTFAFFFVQCCYEVHSDTVKDVPMTAQQSKLCLGEFQAKNCDPLVMTDECSKLMICIQKGVGDGGFPWLAALGKMVEKVTEDLPILGAVVGVLMMFQLKGLVRGHNPHKDD